MSHRVFTPDQDKQVADLYRSGLSIHKIAQMYNCDKGAVSNALERQGVNRRTNRDLTNAEELMIARIHQITGAAPYKIARVYGKGTRLIHDAIKRQGKIKKDGRFTLAPSEEEQIAKIYKYSTANARQIADAYGISHGSARSIFDRQGVKLTSQRRIENPELIVSEYENGASWVSVAKKYNLGTTTVKRLLTSAGVETRPNRTDFFNQEAFDDLNNELALYWLGFIYADGCTTGHEVKVGLAIVDLHHLERFKQFLNSTSGIYTNYRACHFSVSSLEFKNKVADLGVIRSRGQFERLASKIPQGLAHHFIRGYLDGDGCISVNRQVVILGQPDILAWIRDTLHREAGANKTSIRKRRGISEISWGGRLQTWKIVDYLYRDATIWLERKRAIADSWK